MPESWLFPTRILKCGMLWGNVRPSSLPCTWVRFSH